MTVDEKLQNGPILGIRNQTTRTVLSPARAASVRGSTRRATALRQAAQAIHTARLGTDKSRRLW
jgi:hypothetical protein